MEKEAWRQWAMAIREVGQDHPDQWCQCDQCVWLFEALVFVSTEQARLV